MLETDADGNLVVEHGDVHREVFVSNSPEALSRADIAELEGLEESQITDAWLANNPIYGGSEEMALDSDAGLGVWEEITDASNGPTSHWLLFERGYEYDDVSRVVGRGVDGESELNPLYIGAYGDGAAPVLSDEIKIFQAESSHIVFDGVHFEKGANILWGENILLNNIISEGELNVQNIDGFTLRDSEVLDAVKPEPVNTGQDWHQSNDRISGIFIKNSEGVLIEQVLFDHNGWGEGYDYSLNGEDPQPPSMFSHNVYVQFDNLDVTFRDNISMRGASFGAQIRSGGFIEDNVFLDNNAGVNFLGGRPRGGDYDGNYTLLNGNLVTSGAHKEVARSEGALGYGIGDYGSLSTLVNNIVTHLADPNNPDELAWKTQQHTPLDSDLSFYNDTIVYNWVGAEKYHHSTSGTKTSTVSTKAP